MSKLICSFEGIDGSHSSLVLKSFCDQMNLAFEPLGVPTLRHVATSVLTQKSHIGLLPIDNAITGTIRDGYDLLTQYNLVPFTEIQWKMDHRLLAVDGAALSGIREVYAHPLVIGECGQFLGTLTGAKIIPCEDTGFAAKEVAESKDPTKAAIAPPTVCQLYGLVELAKSIADHPENFTRFILFHAPTPSEAVANLRKDVESSGQKTSLVMSTANDAGALYKCLQVFNESKINLTKLESRPKLGKSWEYLFYVDFEGNSEDEKVKKALQSLEEHTSFLQVVGSYENCPLQKLAEKKPAKKTTQPREENWSAEMLPNSSKNWPKVSRAVSPKGSKIVVNNVTIGADDFIVIAGPCSVESKEQVLDTAKWIKENGAVMLRGGAFKPRTHPYSFQGMGWEGVQILSEAGRTTGLPVVSEVMSVDQVEKMAREVDVLQVGARNMQNFDLLRAIGKTQRAVLLKRGMSASIDELLCAAEYILSEGNPNVMLCERGIRTFETATRNTLDLSAVPVLRERTHLPIIVDPSHAIGVRRWIRPLCRAAKAVGAHGIIIEVHPDPEKALSDKDQALTFDDFVQIMNDLEKIPAINHY